MSGRKTGKLYVKYLGHKHGSVEYKAVMNFLSYFS